MSRSRGQKLRYHVKGLVTRNTHMQHESPLTSGKKVMAKVKVFSKVSQTSMSRSRDQKLWYHVKGLVTRNTHMQHESHLTSGKKVMAKVKVFHKKVRLQGQCHEVKNYQVKGLLTRNTHVQYESAFASSKKVMAKVKVFVHASNADTDTGRRHKGFDISSPDIRPGSLKWARNKTHACVTFCQFAKQFHKRVPNEVNCHLTLLSTLNAFLSFDRTIW